MRPRPTSTSSPPYNKITDESARSKHFSTPPTQSPTTPSSIASQTVVSPTSISGRLSLSSNRPAPPSPTPSRHPSLRANSTAGRSRPSSSALSIASSSGSGYPRSKSKLQPTDALEQRATSRPRKTSILIKIRDFGFPSHDERHLGTIRTSVSKTTSRNSRSSGSSGRGWSGFAARFGFGSFGSGSGNGNGTDKPRRSGSLSRRSSQSRQSVSSTASSKSGARQDDSSADEMYYDSQEYSDSLAPFPPGIYRALYAFEPEGPAEMALEEDQLVTALGRGGGDGWVIVLNGDNQGGQALVPEGYLELVTAHEPCNDTTTDGDEISRSGTPKA